MSNSRYFFSKTMTHDTKKEIAEVGLSEFKSTIISSKGECIESIKKEPKGSVSNGSICLKWWRLGDSNS